MRSLFFLSALVAGGYAAPLEQLAPRAVSSTLFAQMTLFEQYTAAAYCTANTNGTAGTAVDCENDQCDSVEAAGAKTTVEFENTPLTDTTGYVAVDNTNKLIVVSFRGSTSIRNWITDLVFDQVDTTLCTGCKGHAGFWASWGEARTVVTAAVKSAHASYPTYSIVVTGHSLGGAVGTLAAAELRNSGYTVALYTYGSPRVGNTALSQYITDQSGGNYRVTHYNDIVPRLPPIAFGYVHISPEYYINVGNGVTVTSSNIVECDGLVNYKCNTAWVVTDVTAHLWYFNYIDCGNDSIELVKRSEDFVIIAEFTY